MIAAPIVVELGRHIGRSETGGPQPTDLCVFVVLAQHLDTIEFREMKLASLQYHLPALSLPTLSRSIRRLVEQGYLIRAARTAERREYAYRIPLSRRAPILRLATS
jgi:hypothetical protein